MSTPIDQASLNGAETLDAEKRDVKKRDIRLDFFRGIGMFIILIAHIPWNPLMNWIPARFGFSDATEVFVFCSGFASALAFSKVFEQAGFWLGSARIMHRIWQVYWSHIAVFFTLMAIMVFADQLFGGVHYSREELPFNTFLDNPGSSVIGLLTLTYVPNYFNILPMYLVMLAMIPCVMAVSKISSLLTMLLLITLWALTYFFKINLFADPAHTEHWFFNPFSWQIIFFSGFAVARGWLPALPTDQRLVYSATIILVLSVPFSCHYGFPCYAGYGLFPLLGEIHDWLAPLTDKTHVGPLRIIHFYSLAYLCMVVAGKNGSRLNAIPGVKVINKVGQQALAVFLTGLVTAQILGIILDHVGRDSVQVLLANTIGFAILIGTAYSVSWFKSSPWHHHKIKAAQNPNMKTSHQTRLQNPAEKAAI